MALKGTSGNDIFFGSLFAEQIFGFGGDDFIKGSPGADTIDGGSGSDIVDYSEFFTLPFDVAGKAVDVDLERPVQFGGFAEGDVLIGIERITGSRENDTIRGDGAANVFFGEGGDDVLEGRGGDDALFGDFAVILVAGSVAGDDHLDGGAGDDRLRGRRRQRHADRRAATTIDCSAGTATTRCSAIRGIDRSTAAPASTRPLRWPPPPVSTSFSTPGPAAAGDAAGDALSTSRTSPAPIFRRHPGRLGGANVLTGGNGNDTLAGLGRADTLNGGNGSDTATYAASASGVVVDLTPAPARRRRHGRYPDFDREPHRLQLHRFAGRQRFGKRSRRRRRRGFPAGRGGQRHLHRRQCRRCGGRSRRPGRRRGADQRELRACRAMPRSRRCAPPTTTAPRRST